MRVLTEANRNTINVTSGAEQGPDAKHTRFFDCVEYRAGGPFALLGMKSRRGDVIASADLGPDAKQTRFFDCVEYRAGGPFASLGMTSIRGGVIAGAD